MGKIKYVAMLLSDISQAAALLTRLPVGTDSASRGGAAAWAYPLAGLLLGALAALAGAVASGMGLPGAVAALLCLLTLIVLTGALHEDGLADTADGLWGGWSREARLEIMKDSRIGTYGVLALILSVAARWSALWLLFENGTGKALGVLVAAAMLSRAAMPVVMTALPHARASGLSHSVGTVPKSTAAIACVVALVPALVLTGGAALWAAFWCAAVTWVVITVARRKIGGQTGDILGATQQICEIAVLFSLLA